MQNLPVKSPPFSLDHEEAVLGALFINPKILPKVRNILHPNDFYKEANAYIYEAFCDCRTDIDILTIWDILIKKDLSEKCGGQNYLAIIANCVSTSVGVEQHAMVVKDLSERRQLISLCSNTCDQAFQNFTETPDILSDHKTKLREIEKEAVSTKQTNKDLVSQAYDLIKERSLSDNKFIGVLTGLDNIDNKIFGLENKCTYYISAERSTGKSALALNIAMNIQQQGHVLYFSLESTNIALMFRQIAKETGIHLTRIRTGNIHGESEWESLSRAYETLSGSRLTILDNSEFQNLDALYSYCQTQAMDNKISLVVVDYIQLMGARGRFNNRHLELSHISKMFNFLAKDIDCPVIVLSQLNKEKTLKESGDLENSADSVWRLEKVTPESLFIKLIATKGKDSGTWSTWLKFNAGKMLFSDCNEDDIVEAKAEEQAAKEDKKEKSLDTWKRF